MTASKIRNKNLGHVFLDFILLLHVALEKFGKKQFGQVGLLKIDFSKPRISRFRVQILKIPYINF